MPDRPVGGSEDGLRRAVRAVAWLAPELDDVGVAEVLWLAAAREGRLPAAERPAASTDTNPDAPASPPSPAPSTEAPTPPPAEKLPPPEATRSRRTSGGEDVYENIAGARETAVAGRPVPVPRAGALPKTLEVGRALRPLKRAWAPGPRQALDIEATARNYARSGELLPTLRARRERFLDLALVVDRSSSMAVWSEVAAEFATVLRRLGAFKRVRIWDLTMSGDGTPRLRPANSAGPGEPPPTGPRNQIVVLSDCSADGWYRPPIWALLHRWGATVPTTLVNPLPSRLWRLTGLDLPAVRVVSTGAPAVRNTRLDYHRPWHLRFGEAADTPLTPLPVVMLTPYGLESWARVLMSAGSVGGADLAGCDAVLVPERGRFASEYVEDLSPLSAEELVEGFLNGASAPAARLAVMCAPYTSLTMPLLHLVRQTMVPEADVESVAEVVVSRLFTTSTTDDGAAVLHPRAGVQAALEKQLGADDAWQMYEVLTRYIADHAGSLTALAAAIRDPGGPVGLPAELLPFAAATVDTLRVLGALPPSMTVVETRGEAADAGEVSAEAESRAAETELGKVFVFHTDTRRIGTSTTLVSAAWILASHGKRVLVAEWVPEDRSVAHYLWPLLGGGAGTAEKVSVAWDFAEGGTLDYLPAGLDAGASASAGSSADHLSTLRETLQSGYDYALVLIAGWNHRYVVTDSLAALADTVVVCFPMARPDAIDREVISAAHDGLFSRFLPMPMGAATPDSRVLAREFLDGLPNSFLPHGADGYWETAGIPYQKTAIDDIPAVFEDVPGEPGTVLAGVENLVGWLTDGAITRLPPMEESERRQIRALYTEERILRSIRPMVVAYVGADRLWAEWVAAVLGTVAPSVGMVRIDTEAASPLAEYEDSHLVVLTSDAFEKYPWARDFRYGLRVDGRFAQLTFVGVFNAPPPIAVVEIGNLDEAEAKSTLLRAVELEEFADRSSPVAARFPTSIPQIWNVSSRNASFTGREDLLERLRDSLTNGSSVAVTLPVVLQGLGGSGRTQLALEYVHRFRADYDLVWWWNARQPGWVEESFADLARFLGLPLSDNVTEDAEAARDALRRGEPFNRWLLVFDNADDPEELLHRLPDPAASGVGSILITTRNQAWSRVSIPIEVDVFSRTESIELLTRGVPGLTREEANAIAFEVGDLPLAVETAAAWLTTTGTPVALYLESLRQETTKILSFQAAPSYPMSVASVWNVSIGRLQAQNPAAARLLEILAFMNGDGISLELITSHEMVAHLRTYDPSMTEPAMVNRAVSEVAQLSLAKVNTDSNEVLLHRLVQNVVRDRLDERQQNEILHHVHRLLVEARPFVGDTDDPENWYRFATIWPHLGPSRAVDCDEDPVRQLLIDRVRYLMLIGEYQAALEFGHTVENRWAERLDLAGPDTQQELLLVQLLALRGQLAEVIRAQGQFSNAYALDIEILASQRDILGPQHPHTLLTQSALAEDLRGLGRWQEALAMDEQSRAYHTELLGVDDPHSLRAALNLGISHRLLGHIDQARAIHQEVFGTSIEVMGPRHPATLIASTELAADLRAAGHYGQSVDLLRSTLIDFRDVLGEGIPGTIRAANSLAMSLYRQGLLEAATLLSRTTLDLVADNYSADNPDTLSCAVTTALCQGASGDTEEALRILENTLDAYVEACGHEHPFTLVCRLNLGIHAGMASRSADLLERALGSFARTLGEQHPYSATAALNLANSMIDDGRGEQALALAEAAANSFQTLFGPRHPNTLVAWGNHAIMASPRGAFEYSYAAETLAELLGDHGWVRTLREGQLVDLDLEMPSV